MYITTDPARFCKDARGLGQFPPPPDLEELSEEETRKLDEAARLGLVVVIVLGVGALVIDAILKRRR